MRVLLSSLFLFLSSVAFGAGPITIKIPCDTDPFPACAALKKRLIEGNTAAKQVGLRGAVRELMDDIYAGKVKVSTDTTGAASCTTFNLAGKPPICPPLPVSENGCRDEFLKNSLDQECGAISKVGPKGDGKYYYTLGRSSGGTLETANITGALVLAVSNEAVDLEAEMQQNNVVVPTTSPCYTQAESLAALIREQSDVKLLDLVKGCDMTQTETCSTKKYFEGNLETIQTAYVLLARCRLTAQATAKFRAFALDYPKRIEDLVLKQCFYNNRQNPSGMKSCYRRGFENWVKREARVAFPNAAAACSGGPTGSSGSSTGSGGSSSSAGSVSAPDRSRGR
jgi:hypothetical protein